MKDMKKLLPFCSNSLKNSDLSFSTHLLYRNQYYCKAKSKPFPDLLPAIPLFLLVNDFSLHYLSCTCLYIVHSAYPYPGIFYFQLLRDSLFLSHLSSLLQISDILPSSRTPLPCSSVLSYSLHASPDYKADCKS